MFRNSPVVESGVDLNVLGAPLALCRSRLISDSTNQSQIRAVTGFYRDGYCRTGPEDLGSHTICAEITPEYLKYIATQGHELETPRGSYAGIRGWTWWVQGDAWCLCAKRWREAVEAGVVLPARIEASERSALSVASKEELVAGKPLS